MDLGAIFHNKHFSTKIDFISVRKFCYNRKIPATTETMETTETIASKVTNETNVTNVTN